jgi:hypothetical protein
MIASNSRYANSALVTEDVNGKDTIYITPSAPVSYTFKYSYYIVNGSDRIDNIAAAYFGDPTQWYLIGDANPQVMNWLSIPAGTIIRIPQVAVSS